MSVEVRITPLVGQASAGVSPISQCTLKINFYDIIREAGTGCVANYASSFRCIYLLFRLCWNLAIFLDLVLMGLFSQSVFNSVYMSAEINRERKQIKG